MYEKMNSRTERNMVLFPGSSIYSKTKITTESNMLFVGSSKYAKAELNVDIGLSSPYEKNIKTESNTCETDRVL